MFSKWKEKSFNWILNWKANVRNCEQYEMKEKRGKKKYKKNEKQKYYDKACEWNDWLKMVSNEHWTLNTEHCAKCRKCAEIFLKV